MYLSVEFIAIATCIATAIAIVMTFKEDAVVNGVMNFINKIGK